jgi:hypothetical protein
MRSCLICVVIVRRQDQTLRLDHPHRAQMIRRDLATTAALFARGIDGRLAHHDLQTGDIQRGHYAE